MMWLRLVRPTPLVFLAMLNLASCEAEKPSNARLSEAPVSAAHPEFASIAGTALEVKPPVEWKRARAGNWGILTSPDEQARLAYVVLDAPDTARAKIDELGALVGASDIRLSDLQPIKVGHEQIPAQAADGSCRLSSGDGYIAYAILEPRDGKQAVIAYIFGKDAPESLRKETLTAMAELRGKRN